MKNYKTVLQISAKPESRVAFYLLICFFTGLTLIFYSASFNHIVLLSVIPYLYIFYQSWKRYYCLSSAKSIQSVSIEGNDSLTIQQFNGEVTTAQIVDQLLVNRTLILYFCRVNHFSDYSNDAQLSEGLQGNNYDRFKRYLINKKRLFCKEITLFFSVNRMIFIVSEQTVGTQKFKQLLRRLNAL